MNIAILYPWGDILKHSSGACLRVNLLTDYLKERCKEVRVFSIGNERDVHRENVHYSFYQQPHLVSQLSDKCYGLYYRVLDRMTSGKSRKEARGLWRYYEYYFDPVFVNRITGIVRWADVVFLKYPFWASRVAEKCRRYQKPLILTTYDVCSDAIVEVPFLRQWSMHAEIRAMRRANHVVCVSVEDQTVFKQYGIDAEVIPHPIDLNRCQPRSLSQVDLKHLTRLGVTQGNLCMFVGSLHTPNVEAVHTIRRVAALTPNSNFVIVGGCCAPELNGNFLAVGVIPPGDPAFQALYNAADLLLAPLRSGTGASLKVIEGMAFGKPVLGTSVGFRGYLVESGINCVICNDFAGYPEIITRLMNDLPRRREIGSNARRFAEAYGYRRVFQRYAELIGL